MKVLIPIWESDPHLSQNPYVATLTDSITEQFGTIFSFSKELFWDKQCEEFDIIHFMWPQLFTNHQASEFRERVIYLKDRGVKIISTCHNIVPHSEDKIENEFYEISYFHSNIIIHLGEYSRGILQSRYPESEHVLIPHHCYNSLYRILPSPAESFSHLKMHKFWKQYILCIGAFRNSDEKRLIRALSRKLMKNKVAIVAPTLRYHSRLSLNYRSILSLIKIVGHKILYPNLIISGRYVRNEDIPFYFGISDALIIQRIRITNSGNLPLGFLFGKAVIGPDVGNVGEILRATNNAVFNPYDIKSVYLSSLSALNNKAIGKQNQSIAINQWSTEIIATRTQEVYNTLIII